MCREVEKLVMAERNEGRLEEKVNSVRAIMESLSISVDEAMKLLKTPESDQDVIRKLIAQ